MDKQPVMRKSIEFACLFLSILYHMRIKYKDKVINISELKMSTFNAKVFSCFFTFSNMHISKQLYLCVLYNYMFLMGVGAGSGS